MNKLFNQGVKKVIVAVPERSIGASFATTDLTTYGFFRAIELIVSGQIQHYRYDDMLKEIVAV
ncbi:MAG: hypothetical protein V3U71_10275 [Cocleimonas sp.]